jgi:hypothetical protein
MACCITSSNPTVALGTLKHEEHKREQVADSLPCGTISTMVLKQQLSLSI